MSKLDLAKRKAEQAAGEDEISTKIVIDQKAQVEALGRVERSIEQLYETINDQKPLDLSVLEKQLAQLHETLDLSEQFQSLRDEVRHSKADEVTVKEFGQLLEAVKTNKPLPINIDLSSLEKAIIQVEQRIQEGSVIDQAPEDYQPMRRVVKVGNRLIFDDHVSSGRGGGGGMASLVIQDEGGDKVTVTGGKLDVNATASLAGEALPVSGATEGVAVAIVDGSGNQITSFGGGTQYTEGDTDASITGTALMMEGAANALVAAPGTAANGLDVDVTRVSGTVTVDGSGVTQPVSGTVTANLSATDNAVLDDIAADTESIKVAVEILDNTVSGSEMQVDIVSGSLTAVPEKASSATLANVATSTASATLLASNAARKKAVIVNDSAALLYVKYGTTASATSFSYLLQPYDTLVEVNYTGRIDGILASGTGNARTTEL